MRFGKELQITDRYARILSLCSFRAFTPWMGPLVLAATGVEAKIL